MGDRGQSRIISGESVYRRGIMGYSVHRRIITVDRVHKRIISGGWDCPNKRQALMR